MLNKIFGNVNEIDLKFQGEITHQLSNYQSEPKRGKQYLKNIIMPPVGTEPGVFRKDSDKCLKSGQWNN